jgi:hypothetical protein
MSRCGETEGVISVKVRVCLISAVLHYRSDSFYTVDLDAQRKLSL